jgi:hypothetical protein
MKARSLGIFVMAALLVALGVFALAASTQAADAEPAQADAATLAVAHFAPFASSIPSTSVTITVNGADAITDLVFGEVVQGVTLTAGTYEFGVVPTGSVTAVLTFTAPLTDGQDLLVAAIGGANGWPLEPFVLVNDRTPFTDGAKVRISHLSPFSTTLAGTSVDVCTEGNTKVVEDLQYKETTGTPASNGYVNLPPGIYDLKIAVGGTNCATVAFDVPPVALRTGMVVDIAAIGLPGGSPAFDLWTDGLTARARVGHFAPFTDPISTSVTILVDGQPLLTDFKFPELTDYVPVPLGAHLIEVVPTGSVTPAITGTVVVSGLLDYTLAAIGDGANQPLELAALVDDNATPPSEGKARVRLSHFAPFANTIPGTSVDICAAPGSALVQDFQYKESETVELDEGIYRDVFVQAAGLNCVSPGLFALPDFIVGAGDIAYVFAVGDGTNAAPTVVAAPDVSVKIDWLFPMVFHQVDEQ